MTGLETVTLQTPKHRSVSFDTRPGTNDHNVCIALNTGDEYGMASRSLSGWLIDIGAHIGALSVSAALDNPELRVLAVEAVPDNCDLLQANIDRNLVGSRVTVVRAAAAAPGQSTVSCHWGYTHHESAADDYLSAHRFVGNTWVDLANPEFGGDTLAVSLDTLLEQYDITEVALLKIDCEGCEWQFLDTDLSKIRDIVGEYHGGYGGHPAHVPKPAERIRKMLEPTHHVTVGSETVVGPFSGTRR